MYKITIEFIHLMKKTCFIQTPTIVQPKMVNFPGLDQEQNLNHLPLF